MSKIAFIGLGNMGSGMCVNLVKAGLNIHAFDLSLDAVAKVAAAGAISHENTIETARDADIVITMLPAGEHVRNVYLGDAGIAEHVSDNALFIDCSTISVDDARSIAADLSALHLNMVDAPVSGGTAAANAGSLTFMVGGEDKNFDRAKVYLEAMGKNIFHAGNIGNGQVAKLANNMLLGISMIATSEAFKLAEKLGLDAQTFFDISSKASGQNWSMTSYCPAPGPVPAAPSNNEYKPGFAVDMMLKDLRLAQDAATSVGAKVAFGKMAEETYANLSNNGSGGLDFSSVIKQMN